MHEQIKSQRESQPLDAHMYQPADPWAGVGDESSDDSNFNSDGEPCSPIDERKNLQNLAKNSSLTSNQSLSMLCSNLLILLICLLILGN